MGVTASSRSRALAVLFAVAGLLLAGAIQCALQLSGHGTVHDSHLAMSAEQAISHAAQAGHAHVEGAAHHMKPDVHAALTRPRDEGPLRLLAVVAAAGALLLGVLPGLAVAQRGPPGFPAFSRAGRATLCVLCVNRR